MRCRIDVDAEEARAVHGGGQRLGAAHAAQAAGDDELAGERAAEVLAAPARRRSRRCPARCPGCRCRSRSRRSSGRTSSGPVCSRRWNSSQVAQWPTRLELAMQDARGDSGCVRKMPTGLPDWTSSVSSFSSDLQGADDGVEARPVARGLAGAAVDDEIVGALGDLGIEVVHEHAQGGFLVPALAGDQARATRGADDGRTAHCSTPIAPEAIPDAHSSKSPSRTAARRLRYR